MMKGIIALIGVVFLLGCIGGDTAHHTDVNSDLNGNGNANGSEGLSGSVDITGIDTSELDIPDLPSGDDSAQLVTDSACQGIDSATAFGNAFAQAQFDMKGATLTYQGVAEYKGALWCKTLATQPGEGDLTLYQNPFVDETWWVSSPQDGHYAEMHIKNSTIIEVCDNGACQPFGAPPS